MAQPKSDYAELHPIYTTYKAASALVFDRSVAGGNANVEKAVMKTATDREVALVTAGLQVLGILKKLEPDNYCSVHEGRYILVTGDGTTINVGDFVVGGATAGLVKARVAEAFLNAKVVALGDVSNTFWVQIL